MANRSSVLAALPAPGTQLRCPRCACGADTLPELSFLPGSHVFFLGTLDGRCAGSALSRGLSCTCICIAALVKLVCPKHSRRATQVMQALTVSTNKLGDRKYIDGDLLGAQQLYTEALRIRQGFCSSSSKPASVEMQLGIVTSFLKILDLEQVGSHLQPTQVDQCLGCISSSFSSKGCIQPLGRTCLPQL